ncbi:hypothetical protein H8356DRAFT_1353557 [Neocallimastix lanati (nom. inval.)]|nr:hypothetical protein H8356DRAFT_1353557 [Neocallimastix sp. JGI-2020a]
MEENIIIDVNNSEVYKCTEINKEILKYDSLHNHPEKEYDVSLSIMKHKIKDGIEKSSIPFDLYIQNIIQLNPKYQEIKIKKLSSNVTTFAEIPNESKYYKTKRVKLFREYNDDIFVDGTFFIAPKFSYQIFITRTYAKGLNSFYTTSFAILKNKEQETYKILFEKLKKKNANTCNNNIIIAELLNSNEISVLIERYKNIETKLIDAKCDRNNTINLWFDCLTDLNNK